MSRRMITEEQVKKIAQESVSGGTQLYKHVIEDIDEQGLYIVFVSTSNTPFIIDAVTLDINNIVESIKLFGCYFWNSEEGIGGRVVQFMSTSDNVVVYNSDGDEFNVHKGYIQSYNEIITKL